MTTWRKEIEKRTKEKLVFCTLDERDLDTEFDSGFGCEEGKPFTAWTENFVLFPACYDGSEWVGIVPRNPCRTVTSHVGG